MTTNERILITVKTYPSLSAKYGELVCTAGIKEDGSWIRIYPLPFRRFEHYKRFKKYTWIEIKLTKNTNDPRPESFRPVGWDNIKIYERVDSKDNWQARKNLILKTEIHNNMRILIDKAKANQLSLATFKPTQVCDFIWEEVDREWNPEKVDSVLMDLKQGLLFDPEGFVKDFKIMPKLPYRFSYIFSDYRREKKNVDAGGLGSGAVVLELYEKIF
jgi:hypothetical protein